MKWHLLKLAKGWCKIINLFLVKPKYLTNLQYCSLAPKRCPPILISIVGGEEKEFALILGGGWRGRWRRRDGRRRKKNLLKQIVIIQPYRDLCHIDQCLVYWSQMMKMKEWIIVYHLLFQIIYIVNYKKYLHLCDINIFLLLVLSSIKVYSVFGDFALPFVLNVGRRINLFD